MGKKYNHSFVVAVPVSAGYKATKHRPKLVASASSKAVSAICTVVTLIASVALVGISMSGGAMNDASIYGSLVALITIGTASAIGQRRTIALKPFLRALTAALLASAVLSTLASAQFLSALSTTTDSGSESVWMYAGVVVAFGCIQTVIIFVAALLLRARAIIRSKSVITAEDAHLLAQADSFFGALVHEESCTETVYLVRKKVKPEPTTENHNADDAFDYWEKTL